MSKVQVDTIDTRSGTSTMQIGSTNTSTINIGVSGDTVNIPSGVTIANAGTATGFGGDNTPAFHVRKSSNQTGLTSGGWTKITFDDEVYDTDNAFASNKFTAPSDGKYFFTSSAKINPATSNDLVGSGMRLEINGAIAATCIHFENQNPSAAEGKTITAVLDLTANQYVEVYAYSQDGAGSSPTITGGNDRDTFFMGFKLIT